MTTSGISGIKFNEYNLQKSWTTTKNRLGHGRAVINYVKKIKSYYRKKNNICRVVKPEFQQEIEIKLNASWLQ